MKLLLRGKGPVELTSCINRNNDNNTTPQQVPQPLLEPQAEILKGFADPYWLWWHCAQTAGFPTWPHKNLWVSHDNSEFPFAISAVFWFHVKKKKRDKKNNIFPELLIVFQSPSVNEACSGVRFDYFMTCFYKTSKKDSFINKMP